MTEDIFKILHVNRDAVETNRGFYYQYLSVLKKWIQNFIAGHDIAVFTEVEDDIKEVGNDLIFSQIKCYSSSFTLNSKEIKKALYNFFILFLQYNDTAPGLRFSFETNTVIGKNDKLLKKWFEQQPITDLELMSACQRRIENILDEEIKRSRRVKTSPPGLSDEKKKLINEAYRVLKSQLEAKLLKKFILNINWKFSGKSPEEAIHRIFTEIRSLLTHEKFDSKPVDILLNALLSEIYNCSQIKDKNRRVLENNTLVCLLQKTEDELGQYINPKLIKLFGSSIDKLHTAIEELQQAQSLQRAEIETIRDTISNKVPADLPKLLTTIPFINNQSIVGRDKTIEEIHSLLSERKNVAVRGTCGLGKSTVVKFYLHHFQHQYDHILWLNITGGLIQSLVFNEDLLYNLRFSFKKDEDINYRFRMILAKLRELQGRNLIILNNYSEDFTTLEPLLALNQWSSLITTRSSFNSLADYKLDKLNFEQASQIYYGYSSEIVEETILANFFKLVDYNTLVIELTAKTIRNSFDLDLSKFMDFYKNQQLDDTELEIDIEVDDASELIKLFPFLENTFSIANLSQNEEALINFLALLPSETKISDIIAMCGTSFEKTNKIHLTNLFNTLHRKGWLERDGDNLIMHKVLQEVLLYNQRVRNNRFVGHFLFINWLIARFHEGFAGDPGISIRFLAYGEAILKAIREKYREGIYQPLIALENEVLNVYRWTVTQNDIVVSWAELTRRAQLYIENDDALLGVIYNNYALALAEKKSYELAENFFMKSIEIFKKHEEKGAHKILNSLSNLSILYMETNDFKSFQKTFNECETLRKKHDLGNDQTFAVQCNSLGVANQAAGNYSAAINLFEWAIKLHLSVDTQKVNEIPLILYLNNLTFNLFITGEKDQAIKYQNKALQLSEKSDFKNNRIKLITMQSLLSMYEETGDSEKILALKTRIDHFAK